MLCDTMVSFRADFNRKIAEGGRNVLRIAAASRNLAAVAALLKYNS